MRHENSEGVGLFFARMLLFTDDTFSEAYKYQPKLKTNETVYAGVRLVGGPANAALRIMSCWASNVDHDLMASANRELARVDYCTNFCA